MSKRRWPLRARENSFFCVSYGVWAAAMDLWPASLDASTEGDAADTSRGIIMRVSKNQEEHKDRLSDWFKGKEIGRIPSVGSIPFRLTSAHLLVYDDGVYPPAIINIRIDPFFFIFIFFFLF